MSTTLLALAFALGAVAADPSQDDLPPWFLGAWKREWIRRAGLTDDSVTVRFLQTPTMFGDVRIPADRPSFPEATSLADLTDPELRSLANQKGFFGYTTIAGNIATWHHEIDYQPPDGEDDIGRLERVGSGMYEHALDESYVERWGSLSSGDGRFLVVRVTRLDHGKERLERVLLVAGDHFLYARNRAQDLPMAASLPDLIAKTHATRERVLAYLDCELSQGYARGGSAPWSIVRSTLPWREGTRLELAGLIAVDSTGKLSPRAASGDTWTFPVNTMAVEDLRVLFPSAHD